MVTITYIDDTMKTTIEANRGEKLLKVLQNHQINVYGTLSTRFNCGGRGICATCGVYILHNATRPTHWHDRLADQFGYPRLACQMILENDITIMKPKNKIVWGQLLPKVKR